MQVPFLSALASRTEVGVELCFRTDYEPYFAAAAATLRSHPAWEVIDGAKWPFELETVFQARAGSYQSMVARRALMV
jgi:tRNA (guanine-N7-)-methyltransferase